MFSRASFITSLITIFILASGPAHSAVTVYTWRDASGVITFSDNPTDAPRDAQVEVLSEYSNPQPVSETDSTEAAAAEIPERPSRVATQGEFATQLVRELGLGKAPSAKEAADILTTVRIAPPLGRWELDQPMTPELTVRLRTLTVAAAKRGEIAITPEQALLAFDTAAALLDVSIPATTPPDTSESSYPVVEAPPVVYLYPPPPDIYPYYIWVPVAGGFWWNNFLFPGFFVLDVNLFFFNDHRFFFRDQFLAVNVSVIQRHFLNRIIDHHLRRVPATRNPGIVRGPRFATTSASDSNRINPQSRLRQGLRPPGLHPPGIQSQRHLGFQRAPAVRPMMRHPASPFNSITPRPMARPAFPTPSVRHFSSPAFAHPQSTFLETRRFAPSASHGFSNAWNHLSFGRVPRSMGFSFRR